MLLPNVGIGTHKINMIKNLNCYVSTLDMDVLMLLILIWLLSICVLYAVIANSISILYYCWIVRFLYYIVSNQLFSSVRWSLDWLKSLLKPICSEVSLFQLSVVTSLTNRYSIGLYLA